MFFGNMKTHVLYQLSVCIQVIHHYRFFLPNKNPSIYTSNSFVARAVRNFGWHRQNWHRSSRYSPELAYMVSKNIGSDGSEIQPVKENLKIFVVVRWKKSEHLVEMEGIFHPLKVKHVISTPLLPRQKWLGPRNLTFSTFRLFPPPGWWIPTNRKSRWQLKYTTENEGLVQMIFLFKQVIFRWTMFIFRGVFFILTSRNLGKIDSHFDAYFSNGLVETTN